MRWTVYADDQLIYNPRIVDDEGNALYKIIEPTLTESTGSFSSLTYSALRGSPAYDHTDELKTRIRVYRDGVLYWQGRVLDVTKNIWNQKQVYAEDLLGMLCDAIYEPFEFYGTVTEFLTEIVTAYNAAVGVSQRFISVNCDVDEGNIVRSSEGYATCWNTIKTKLIDMIGGWMWVSYDANEQPILNYSKNSRRASTQRIEFGKNLKDYDVKWSFQQFYTACIPLGHKDDDTKEILTIESVNDGSKILIDSTAAAQYGTIFAPVEETTWDDVTEPANLLVRGQNWIRTKASRAVQEINLTGLDLESLSANGAIVGQSAVPCTIVEEFVTSLDWLDAVVVSTVDFEDIFILKDVSRRLDSPISVEITMGDVRTSLTGSGASKESQTAQRIATIESDYTTTGEAVSIAQEEIRNDTSIIQQAESIIATALAEYVRTNDYETFKEQIRSEFQIQYDQITAEFTSTAQTVADLNGAVTSQFTTINNYIRFLAAIVDEHGTVVQNGGVVIGQSNSDIKLKLENEILYFFTGNESLVSKDNAIAYFESGKLYVNEVQIQKISIGLPGQFMFFQVVGTGDNRCIFLNGRIS